jgi:hypothetical protein
MAVTLTTPNTILGVLEPKSQTTRLVSNVVTVLLGTVLITLAAKINVPTWPVPVTLQSFAVAALAAAFGWRIGTATVIAYLVEGAAGLPVFAGATAGIPYLMGPTGGFLLGFIPMAYIIGRAADLGAVRPRLPLAPDAGRRRFLARPGQSRRLGLRQGRAAVPDLGCSQDAVRDVDRHRYLDARQIAHLECFQEKVQTFPVRKRD